MARLTTTTSASHCSLPAPASNLDVISSGRLRPTSLRHLPIWPASPWATWTGRSGQRLFGDSSKEAPRLNAVADLLVRDHAITKVLVQFHVTVTLGRERNTCGVRVGIGHLVHGIEDGSCQSLALV